MNSIKVIAPKGWEQQSIHLPGSKYIANRLLIMSALCDEEVTIKNLPQNNDIEVAINGLRELGVSFKKDEDTVSTSLTVKGLKLSAIQSNLVINTHESGTFSRFIVAVASLFTQEIKVSGAPRMNQRPMKDLTSALQSLNAKFNFHEMTHHLPLTICGPINGGDIKIAGDVSSQYISALLMTLPLCKESSRIELTSDLVSKSYINLTIALLEKFSIKIKVDESHPNRPCYEIQGGQCYHLQEETITIESDPVSSTYFMAASVLAHQSITIPHFNSEGIQGETDFHQILTKMGAKVIIDKNKITISHHKERELKAIEIDMGTMPDAVPTLCVLAAIAKGTTKITNIAHLRYKESNRIEDMAEELRKAGVKITTSENSISIQGGEVHFATFNSHNDHRLAMSLALMSLNAKEGVIIEDAGAVKKSFPNYYDTLAQLGFQIKEV